MTRKSEFYIREKINELKLSDTGNVVTSFFETDSSLLTSIKVIFTLVNVSNKGIYLFNLNKINHETGQKNLIGRYSIDTQKAKVTAGSIINNRIMSVNYSFTLPEIPIEDPYQSIELELELLSENSEVLDARSTYLFVKKVEI